MPPKFNGGQWTTGRDEREWGESYWHWNQQEVTWPIFAAGHLELHEEHHAGHRIGRRGGKPQNGPGDLIRQVAS